MWSVGETPVNSVFIIEGRVFFSTAKVYEGGATWGEKRKEFFLESCSETTPSGKRFYPHNYRQAQEQLPTALSPRHPLDYDEEPYKRCLIRTISCFIFSFFSASSAIFVQACIAVV